MRNGAFSADGKSIFSCWTSNHLYCSDAASGRDLYSLKLEAPGKAGNAQSGLEMRLSDDGKTLVAVSPRENRDLLVTGWDTTTHKLLFGRTRPNVAFWVVLSPDANTLAVPQDGLVPGDKMPVGGEGPILLEDAATGATLLTFPQVAGQNYPVAFSPDGRLLVTNGGENKNKGEAIARLWDVAAAAEILAFPIVANNTRIAFTPDSRLLAMSATASAFAQTISIWDLRRGQELRHIKDLYLDVSSLTFSPDGRRLASGLADTTILVWDVGPLPRMAAALDADGAAGAWADLSADARKAFAARNALACSPEATLPMLKQHLRPAPPVDAERLGRLLAELGSDQFTVRQKAQKELEDMGELARGAYQRTLAEKPALEVRQRIEGLLQKQRGPVTKPEKLQALRAVAVLEDIATPEARQLLETLARGEPEARVTQEAQTSLGQLARRVEQELSRHFKMPREE